METADTSVLVPLAAAWHEAHAAVGRRCRNIDRLPMHAMLECYSVLTRLPEPHRAAPEPVVAFLDSFGEPLDLEPGSDRARAFLHRLAETDIRGGQAYDAIIGAAALAHGALLLTRDARAAAVYDAIGARVEFIR
jgi:predicted nucleic acid-binding protein